MEPAQQKRQQLHHFTILVEHVVFRLRRDTVPSHQSTTDTVKTSLRRTLSKPFKDRRQPSKERILEEKPVTGADEPKISPTRGKSLRTAPKLSREIMANNLHQVEDYVRRTSVRVQHLEALIEKEYSTIGQVTEIKRQLKTAHRNLEKFHFERCPLLGNDVNAWVLGAMRLAWQAYRRMVKLEEKLRSLPVSLSDSDDWVGDYEKESPVMIGIEMEPEKKLLDADTMAGAAEEPRRQRVQPVTYVPTGMKGARLNAHVSKATTLPMKGHTDTYRMSGALPSTEELPFDPSPTQASSEVIPVTTPRRLPRLITNDLGLVDNGHCDGAYDSDDSLYETRIRRRRAEQRKEWSVVEKLDPVQATLSKTEVEARLREEEEELAPILIEPDRRRQGSCDGSMVTDMVMNNVLNDNYVVPYLHFIKHHELRALKRWLVVNQYVRKSFAISRMEKVLHCIELLQTGCRYETIATIFSRTPRQVESSCHEVMEGLLELHGFTMIKARDQEMYTTLWGLWCRKYENPQNQHPAAYYYGFDWLDIGKVMVTLNLYIGRWREQGKFSLEGPSLNWGKFFDAEGTGRFPRMDQPLRLQYSTISTNSSDALDNESEEEDYDDSDGSLYDGGAVQTV
ncbi:uncharacterized protein M421DRAFT_307540 [Didymella exigua CBS 183.55]|uniref:Uncharacterized protein n=1 Tax=Didymella exigua CBS 183.55 TaxID=1150837 RepID=A0A6A5R8M6_9PLEO|nr:uncharacterized protein M421DRAFT_307540 [Didymella exigua CBS 183.55]KAF1923679.1 hypothetical protein M421DRAFT_307540 [Didymella exigua CBS 183.55]